MMKRYILITNIWGRKADKLYGWNYKELTRNNIICDAERTEFDTMEELNEQLQLFQDYCDTFEKAQRKERSKWIDSVYNSNYYFKNPNQRAWGWLIADRENQTWVWGGEKLYNYDNRTDKLILKDFLFRGPDEIPEGYKWDVGEYEGWLQFRWGDGKNAIGYVEKQKKTRIRKEISEKVESSYDEYEDIENKYAKKEEKELEKILENRW